MAFGWSRTVTDSSILTAVGAKNLKGGAWSKTERFAVREATKRHRMGSLYGV
jgi:hypothetical protein